MTTKTLLTAALAAALLAAGCERDVQLETRTFRVEHLTDYQVEALLEPYVVRDREAGPGSLSPAGGAVTVRETPDNLARIERALEEFDVARPDVLLRFQLVRANGASGADERIDAVVEELRQIFRFEGYSLLGESAVRAATGARIEQRFPGTEYTVTAHVFLDHHPSAVAIRDLQLWRGEAFQALETSVTVSPGQTLVLGGAPTGEGSDGSIILTVTAQEGDFGAN